MAAALIEGALDGGADVLDLGLVGTEMVYFATGELGLDGGVMVTASHNPKQYTGMKIVRARRAAGWRRVGPPRHPRPRRRREWREATRGAASPRHLGCRSCRAVLSFVDLDCDQAATKVVDRRRQRYGRRDAPADPRAPAAG
jgi:phosphomannomutase